MILIDQAVFLGIVDVKAHFYKAFFQNLYPTEDVPEAVVGIIIFDKRCGSHPIVAGQSKKTLKHPRRALLQ